MTHPVFDAGSYPWDLPEAKALHVQLYTSIRETKRIVMVYDESGAGLPPLNQDQPPIELWWDALNNLAQRARLRELCEVLLTRGIVALDAAVRRVQQMRDVVERTQLGDDALVFLDRKDLRSYLDAAARGLHPLKMIVVRGESGSGRTWTRHLVESLALSRGQQPLYYCQDNLFSLDILVDELFDHFSATRPAQFTTDAAGYGQLWTKLALAAKKRNTCCWITVDDLDADADGNPLVDPSIRAFFEQFGRAMVNQTIRESLRLVMLAYPAHEPTPTRWDATHYRIEETRADAVGQTHVQDHLDTWTAARNRSLLVEEREEIVRRVVEAASQAPTRERLRTLKSELDREISKLTEAL